MGDVAVSEGWDFTATGLKLFDPNLPFDRFCDLCVMLGRIHGAVRFAIGDAIIIGPEMYGQEAYQAFELLGLSEAGLMEYLRVSEKVPRSHRRKDLSWSHHRAVAALAPPEQKEWLKKAADEALSHHQLRDALRGGGAVLSPISPASCKCCGRAYG